MEVSYGTLNEVANPVVDERSWKGILKTEKRIASAALAIVDEKSWAKAFNVAQPVVQGELYSASVQDWTTQQQWWEESFPIEIPLGHDVIIGVRFKNTGTAEVYFRVTLQLIDPDGLVAIEKICTPAPPPFVPGERSVCRTSTFAIDKAGPWGIHALLEAEPA